MSHWPFRHWPFRHDHYGSCSALMFQQRPACTMYIAMGAGEAMHDSCIQLESGENWKLPNETSP